LRATASCIGEGGGGSLAERERAGRVSFACFWHYGWRLCGLVAWAAIYDRCRIPTQKKSEKFWYHGMARVEEGGGQMYHYSRYLLLSNSFSKSNPLVDCSTFL